MSEKKTIQQAIADELGKCAADFIYAIIKYFYVEHPIKGKILFKLFPFQEDVIRALQKHRFVCIGKSRQMGISTVMAAYALLNMIFRKNYKVLVIATTQEVASNLVRKVKVMYENLPSFMKAKNVTASNKLSLELPNGSFIKAVSSSSHSGRSEALSLLIIDEAAFIDRFEEIWVASQMTLSTGGDAVILSTPNGVGNLFHKMFTESQEGKASMESGGAPSKFYSIRLPWYLHPERDQKWRDDQTALLGKRGAAQECDVDFLGSGATYIDPEDIQYYMKEVVCDPIQYRGAEQNIWIWNHPDYSKNYVTVVDTSRGDGADNSTIQILDIETLEQVLEFQGKVSIPTLAQIAVSVSTEYNNSLMVIENTGIGFSTVQEVINLRYTNIFYSFKNDTYFDEAIHLAKNYDLKSTKDKVPGFATSHTSRPIVLSKMDIYFRQRFPKIKSVRFWNEIQTFVWKNGRPEAERGYHDDLIIPMAIAFFIRDTALKLKSMGIELTVKTIENTFKTVYKPTNSFNDPYTIKTAKGTTEDLRWLIK